MRFLIGDTDPNYELLQDEEIDYALTQQNNNNYLTAIYCCYAIAAKASSLVDEVTGKESVKGSQIQKQYQERANSIRVEMARLGMDGGAVYVGGIDLADYRKNLLNQGVSVVPKQFNDTEGNNSRAWQQGETNGP